MQSTEKPAFSLHHISCVKSVSPQWVNLIDLIDASCKSLLLLCSAAEQITVQLHVNCASCMTSCMLGAAAGRVELCNTF